jgi:hypothetical protein
VRQLQAALDKLWHAADLHSQAARKLDLELTTSRA